MTVMDLFKCLLLIVVLANYASTESSNHSEEEHEDAFHDILTTLNLNGTSNGTLRRSDVNSILTTLGLHDCTNVTKHKHKCVTAESLFMIFNISNSSSISKQNFSQFAPIMVYALLPVEEHLDGHSESNVHDDHDGDHDHDDDDDHDHDDDDHDDEEHDSDREITQSVDVYNELLERYDTSGLCEQILDQLLKDVNDSTGERLHGGKCFSSHHILHKLNIASDADVGKSLLSEMSVIIISKLIKKQCIEVRYQSPLPCTSYFVNQLFQKYAINGTISEKKVEELMKKLKIGRHEDNHEEEQSDDHGDHDHERRRRSLTVLKNPLASQILEKPLGFPKRYRREAAHHEHGNNKHENETKRYQKCYSVDELFAIFQVDRGTGFKVEKFRHLSSALLQQIESDVCEVEPHKDHSDSVAAKHKWGYGILAVALISLCSVMGVAIIPFLKTIFYQKIVAFLISLAVGTLVGDALLHLFPHAVGFHSGDGHNHGSGHTDESEDRDYLWKFLLAAAAIYGFFLFETVTHLFLRKPIGHSHTVEHTRRHSQFGERQRDHGATEEVGVESNYSGTSPVVLMNMGYVGDGNMTKQRRDDDATIKEKDITYESGFGKSNIKEKAEVKKTISSVAWNIIIGDTIHNIADGIAIGVAFSISISGGVSTAIAVFCHEFPHELGDFAVLLSAGMSVKKALLANFLSACSCFIGLVFGILISEIEDVNLWIFAATAGFFIYIALTNMLPELIHSADFNSIPKISMFLLQNLGILTGFALMFLLSYYEEDINI